MTKTIIGLFDAHAEAKRAVDDLTRTGFARNDVTITRDSDSPTAMELMTDAMVPQQDVKFYAEGVRRGGTLVMVQAQNSVAGQAADIMAKYNMVDVDTRMAEYQQSGLSDLRVSTLDTDGMVIPIMEEQLQVGTRQVQRGGVRVHSRVTERAVEEQVNLRDETVRVERRAVDRPISDADLNAFQATTLEVTETDEEAVVAKTARVIEEVVVGKQVTDRVETVRDTVRRTNVDVEQVGATQSVATTDDSTFDNDFRSYYTSNLSKSGYTYDQYSPVFRYGHGLANDDRYRGKDWSAIETDARRDWETRNPGTWEQFKDSIRYAWERARGQR